MKLANSILYGSAVVALLTAAPANAEWVEVNSTNFRFFSEDEPTEVVERVENLEKLDKIVRTVTGNKQAPSPLRVTAYELGTIDDVQRSAFGVSGAAAYYTTSEEGAHLVTFHRPIKVAAGGRMKRTYNIQDEVTQHEYLHHMMFQYFPSNYPTFYPEGFAEYYGTIQFQDDDVIVVGHAPFGRLEAMRNWLHVRDMLTAKSYADVSNLGGLYAQGWLLTHMAAARPEIGMKLRKYLLDVSKGVPYEEAAIDAFGDLDAFNRELRGYKDDVTALTIKLEGIDPGPVAVRKLSPTEEALVEVELALRSTIRYSEQADLASKVRSVTGAVPADEYGAGLLALTEYLAGNADAARDAANRAIDLNPKTRRGNMVLGMLDTDELEKRGDASPEEWDAARSHFETVIDIDDTNTRNLIEYYDSFAKQGIVASGKGQNALMRAFQLMPRNDNLRKKVARDFEQRGMIEDAIFIISPAAFGTFDGDEREKKKREKAMKEYAEKYTKISAGETPLEMLQRLKAKRDGTWDEMTQSIKESGSVESR